MQKKPRLQCKNGERPRRRLHPIIESRQACPCWPLWTLVCAYIQPNSSLPLSYKSPSPIRMCVLLHKTTFDTQSSLIFAFISKSSYPAWKDRKFEPVNWILQANLNNVSATQYSSWQLLYYEKLIKMCVCLFMYQRIGLANRLELEAKAIITCAVARLKCFHWL